MLARLRQGEQHCGERQNREVRAGPQAEQDCEAARSQRTESGAETDAGVVWGQSRDVTPR
jgi:hypothetical protein